MKDDLETTVSAAEQTVETLKLDVAKLEKQLVRNVIPYLSALHVHVMWVYIDR